MLEGFFDQDVLKTTYDAPKTAQDAPKMCQDASKTTPRRTQAAQDDPKMSFWSQVSGQGEFWEAFWFPKTVRRAQRASERSERSERSVQELEAGFAIQKRSKRLVQESEASRRQSEK